MDEAQAVYADLQQGIRCMSAANIRKIFVI